MAAFNVETTILVRDEPGVLGWREDPAGDHGYVVPRVKGCDPLSDCGICYTTDGVNMSTTQPPTYSFSTPIPVDTLRDITPEEARLIRATILDVSIGGAYATVPPSGLVCSARMGRVEPLY